MDPRFPRSFRGRFTFVLSYTISSPDFNGLLCNGCFGGGLARIRSFCFLVGRRILSIQVWVTASLLWQLRPGSSINDYVGINWEVFSCCAFQLGLHKHLKKGTETIKKKITWSKSQLGQIMRWFHDAFLANCHSEIWTVGACSGCKLKHHRLKTQNNWQIKRSIYSLSEPLLLTRACWSRSQSQGGHRLTAPLCCIWLKNVMQKNLVWLENYFWKGPVAMAFFFFFNLMKLKQPSAEQYTSVSLLWYFEE